MFILPQGSGFLASSGGRLERRWVWGVGFDRLNQLGGTRPARATPKTGNTQETPSAARTGEVQRQCERPGYGQRPGASWDTAEMKSPRHSVRVGEVLVGWAEVGPGAAPAVQLGRADAARAAALPAERRARFVQGRALLHQLLAELQPGVVHQLDAGPCPHCGGAHGPVVVADAAAVVSLSYAADLVVAAVAPTQRISAVGLDAEPDTASSERLTDLTNLIGGPPASALRRWTQLEAVLKADGRGLRVDPQRVRIQADQARIEGEPASYHLTEVAGPPGQVISLAWR